MRTEDGTIISSNTLLTDKPSSVSNHNIFQLLKAVILKVIYTDESGNSYKNGPEYDIMLVSSSKEGDYYKNVRSLNSFGGINNFCEYVYTPRKNIIKGSKNDSSTPPEYTDNSYVMVGFLNGFNNAPVIIGGWPHPENTVQGCTKSEGQLNGIDVGRIKGEYNGIAWEINNKGEFILTYNGGPRDTKTKQTARPSTGPTQIKIDENGKMTISTVGNAKIIIDPSGKVQLQAANIEIGSGAMEFIVQATKLITAFNTHTHPTAALGPPSVPVVALTESQIASSKHKVE